jgi:hypothetical protein
MNRAIIFSVIEDILINDGPDGHCDGADVLTDFTMALLAGPATAYVWVDAYRGTLTLRDEEGAGGSGRVPCPICGRDPDKDISSAKAALSEVGIKAQQVDPGGRYLELSDGSTLRLQENCNACDASAIFGHLAWAKVRASSPNPRRD